jgi:ZIP family zinc transporter
MVDWAVGGAALLGMVGMAVGGWLGPTRKGWRGSIGLLTAGMMLAVAATELLPEAVELSGQWVSFLCFSIGVAAMVFLTYLMPHGGAETAGWLVMLSLMVHNLPEGLSIGAGFSAAPELGMKTALAVGLHVIPEGMELGSLLRRRGKSRWQSAVLAMLTGSPMALGAWIGRRAAVTPLGVGGCLAMAAGAMIYVVAAQVIPEGYDPASRPRAPGLWMVMGFILTMAGLLVL